MRVSDICFDQLKRFEGLRNEAYYDPAGVLTIGYGHTGPDVRPGDVISKYWAEHLLKADLYDVEKAVDGLKVAVTQPQFDARQMCSTLSAKPLLMSVMAVGTTPFEASSSTMSSLGSGFRKRSST